MVQVWSLVVRFNMLFQKDILAFDQAGQVCLDFAAKQGSTLVVQTADHETGGLGLAYQV
jgi:alkaline phosphatase